MVDFNNETTITTNPKDVWNISLLEYNKYILDSIEVYNKHKFNNINVDTNIIRSRIVTLYLAIRQDFKRNTKKEIFEEAEALYNSTNFKDLSLLYIEYISSFLAEIGLTAKTKRKDYDPLNDPG